MLASIQDAEAQTKLYTDHYYNCGPASQSDAWGIDPSVCLAGDKGGCQEAYAQGKCDYNMCQPWAYNSTAGSKSYYTQKRTSFTDPAVAATTCCPEGYKYMFDPKALPGVPRGSCEEVS